MKNFLFLMVVAAGLFSANAHATRYQPIAEVVTSGGFAPVMNPAHSVRIYGDGNIVGVVDEKSESLGQLSEVSLQALLKAVESVEVAQLVDPRPEEPFCMDAPSTVFTVRNGDQLIEIGRNEGCKDFLHTNYSAHAVRSLLTGLIELYRLSR